MVQCVFQQGPTELNRYSELNRLVAPCCFKCGCVEYVLGGSTQFDCVTACCRVHKFPMTQKGVIFSVMPKPFPADAGTLAQTTSDFLSLGMGHRIPGPGWLHPPEVLLEGRWVGNWKPTHLFSCFCLVLTQDGGMRVATFSKTKHAA